VVPVDVNQTLNHALLLVAHSLASTRIDVQRDLQASTLAGFNAQELQQVVINLLLNAIQAMPDGGVLLLRSRDQLDEHGRAGVLIEVCDSGAGLSPQALEQLFRPFFTTKNEGNGLGLWISIGLLERYGASLSGANRSERGEDTPGAVFSLWLLCATPEENIEPG
jgi:signal transduction histidine kinase